MRLLFICLAALLLAGCGSSSKPPQPSPAPTQPTAPRNEPLFMYYGCQGRKELEETADHVSCVWLGWGDFEGPPGEADMLVGLLKDAKELGITKAIVQVGFLMFGPDKAYRGTDTIIAFKQRLEAEALLPMLIGIAVLDEPDMKGMTDAQMVIAFDAAKQVFGLPIWAIFGDHGYPGASRVDVVGTDRYGLGATVLSQMPAWAKRLAVCPGGADPYRNSPEPFYEYATTHPVAGIVAFMYGPYSGHSGIRDNGMLPQYRAIGLACKGAA